MDRQALRDGLMLMAEREDQSTSVQIFLRLLKQVWEIDWTVPAYSVMTHFLDFDVRYFFEFTVLDAGDHAEERQLIMDWIDARDQIKRDSHGDFLTVIDEVNELRLGLQNH